MRSRPPRYGRNSLWSAALNRKYRPNRRRTLRTVAIFRILTLSTFAEHSARLRTALKSDWHEAPVYTRLDVADDKNRIRECDNNDSEETETLIHRAGHSPRPGVYSSVVYDNRWSDIWSTKRLLDDRSKMQDQALHEAIQSSPLILADKVKQQKIENRLAQMRLSAETVRRIQNVFITEMERGIHQQSSSLQMENTYIPELLDGTEEGMFLALDLGGTNFRVLLLELKHGTTIRDVVKRYHIEDDLRVGCAARLFDYLAKCVTDFVISEGLLDVELPLGFTFSFPMKQHSLESGVLVTWTKTFNCPDAVGKDAVKLLREALDRRGGTKVKVMAILNDTTGTLLQGALLDPATAIGLILATGSNGCYLERADRVEQWETERHGEREVIIDIEWGAFGDNGVLDFIKTEYDLETDENSLLVGSFTFEKYIGGKYLGEVVRVILVRLAQEGLLFVGEDLPDSFLTTDTFSTELVSRIEQDSVYGGSSNTREVLASYGIVPDEDSLSIVQYVCQVVSNRAALLVSICLATLLDRIDKNEVTIAVDGSLYKHHPRLKNWMNRYISLLSPGHGFKILLVEDGSGKGAALAAAIAQRLKKRLE